MLHQKLIHSLTTFQTSKQSLYNYNSNTMSVWFHANLL